MNEIDLACPRCGARDKPPPAKPTLEREQDGTLNCTTCSHTWNPKEK